MKGARERVYFWRITCKSEDKLEFFLHFSCSCEDK